MVSQSSYSVIRGASELAYGTGKSVLKGEGPMRKHDELLLRTLRVKRTLETLNDRENALFARLGQKKREESLLTAQRLTGTSRYR